MTSVRILRPGVETPEEVPPSGDGQPLGPDRGTSPHRDWPVAFVIAAVITSCLIALALYAQAQRAMCATHKTPAGHGALQYCPDYQENAR